MLAAPRTTLARSNEAMPLNKKWSTDSGSLLEVAADNRGRLLLATQTGLVRVEVTMTRNETAEWLCAICHAMALDRHLIRPALRVLG